MKYPFLIVIILSIIYKLYNLWLTFYTSRALYIYINIYIYIEHIHTYTHSCKSLMKLYTHKMMKIDSEIIDVIIVDGRHYL